MMLSVMNNDVPSTMLNVEVAVCDLISMGKILGVVCLPVWRTCYGILDLRLGKDFKDKAEIRLALLDNQDVIKICRLM